MALFRLSLRFILNKSYVEPTLFKWAHIFSPLLSFPPPLFHHVIIILSYIDHHTLSTVGQT